MAKREEIQWSVVRQKDASETEGFFFYKTVVRPCLFYGAETLATIQKTRSTTRSKWDEGAEMDVRSDKEG